MPFKDNIAQGFRLCIVLIIIEHDQKIRKPAQNIACLHFYSFSRFCATTINEEFQEVRQMQRVTQYELPSVPVRRIINTSTVTEDPHKYYRYSSRVLTILTGIAGMLHRYCRCSSLALMIFLMGTEDSLYGCEQFWRIIIFLT